MRLVESMRAGGPADHPSGEGCATVGVPSARDGRGRPEGSCGLGASPVQDPAPRRRHRRPAMTPFATQHLPDRPDAVAPDRSDVRILLQLERGGMAHFELAPGTTSRAVAHHTVEEIWFFLSGQGEMWRRQGAQETVVIVQRRVCLTIPLGTHFQFRAHGTEPLAAVAVTMPPWPGGDEAFEVAGKWPE